MRQTFVTLPKGIGVDLAQIPRACPQDTFIAGGCPDVAKIGKIAGALAIADEPLTGDLYLLKPPAGKVLPGLGLAFTGRFAGRVIGSNAVDAKTGQLITQFESVPDLPLTALQIDIAGGTGGPVIATRALRERHGELRLRFCRALGAEHHADGPDLLRRFARGERAAG